MTLRLLTLFSIFCFLSAFELQESIIKNRTITFLQVDLVCGAASDIGCGSRSKPILFDLEIQPEIAEAWLNRPGTIIAVIWKVNQDADEKVLRQILKKHKTSGKVLGVDQSINQEALFRSERWYRSDEVDELSIEEAGRIAEKIMDVLVNQGLIGENESSKMETEVEALIRTELLSLEDVSLLDQRSYYKGWEAGIKDIAKSHMPQEKVDQIRLFEWSPWIKYPICAGIVLVLAFVLILMYRKSGKRSRLSLQ